MVKWQSFKSIITKYAIDELTPNDKNHSLRVTYIISVGRIFWELVDKLTLKISIPTMNSVEILSISGYEKTIHLKNNVVNALRELEV